MPVTLPSFVAPNELIQSAWGNAVVNAFGEVNNEFVDKAGSVMTGTLSIAGTSGQIRIRPTNDQPILDFFDGDAVTRYGLVDATAARTRLFSESAVVLQSASTEMLRGTGTATLFGKTASDLSVSGIEVMVGASVGALRSSISDASIQNLYARHNGSADADGEAFIDFLRGTTEIGNVFQYLTTGIHVAMKGGVLSGTEISDPTAPSANTALLYARDNGSGKTQWVARFPTGAVQVIATEP